MIKSRSELKKKALDEEQKVTFADKVVSTIGSWNFVLIQSIVILFWISYNVSISKLNLSFFGFLLKPFDPYPFIFLNLALSFQAAYTAPIIMMSQIRSAQQDRIKAEADYNVNVLAENEIREIKELLKQRIK